MSGFRPSFGKIAILLGGIVAAIAAAGYSLRETHTPLAKIEPASPAQMQRLQDDHDALNRFLENKMSEMEAKEAERVRALEASRDQAANEARMKAAAAAREEVEKLAREAAAKAAAQRKIAEAAAAKSAGVAPAPLPETPKDPLPVAPPTTIAGEIAPLPPMPIAPQVVQPKRGPLDRAIDTANAVTDRTLAAADKVRSFFTNAAGKLIGISVPPSRLNSQW